MSARRTNSRSLLDSRRQNPRADDRIVDQLGTPTAHSAKKTRGRRQPAAADLEVTFETPALLPILDKELRAIEILLGNELQDLLAEMDATVISPKNIG